ncbi:aquaporin-like protein [Aspergillus avenaceus]|uniref:Aquaporin-like protein n=1 Tax=Aspergillus avenaceus TaxID=36643 RepID=A0A5N6U5G5_ASPAV|nr:aquaporin-like protein [Aspergillus avenaceus]
MSEEQDLGDGHSYFSRPIQTPSVNESMNTRTRSYWTPLHSQSRPGPMNRGTGSQWTATRSHFTQRPSHQPTHSLAGPPEQDSNSVYVHPDYHKMNPEYGKDEEKPLWGLAKPLPRVVRPGMRRHDGGGVTSAYSPGQKGESEPVPELGVTPSRGGDGQSQSQERSGSQGTGPDDTVVHEEINGPDAEGRVSRPVQDEVTEDANKGYMPTTEYFNRWSITTVAILIGLCATLAVSTGGSNAGNKFSVYWAWGLSITVGIYIAGGISGGHLNPAISIALWLYRGFPGRQCAYYVIAQILGALTAAGLAYCIYYDSIRASDPGVSLGANGLGFYTEPLTHVLNVTAFFNEFLAAAILICTIFAMGDDTNAPPGAGMHSFIIGLVIFVLAIGFGYNTGGCFNPARDLGPRLVALMAGYGGYTFTEHRGWWFWGAWLATISGALVGGAMYDIFIFIGGESPINYPRTRRHRAKLKKEAKWRRRLHLGEDRLPSIEEGLKELDN